ncbi:MAG: hypothetical protein AAGE52_13995 [Myxococcota bacterium]
MTGWESIVAAVGGLLLGVGVGLLLARGRDSALRQRMNKHLGVLRTNVIPLLESRAEAVELPDDVSEPLELVERLSTSLRRHEEAQELPFSDTVEFSREEARAQLKKG